MSLACRKAKELGYPHELWTTRLLARHAREHGPAEGHACLANLAQGTVCKILDQEEVKPHKVRYYLEQRDPEFAEKMAEVLCVYRQVKILKQAAAVSKKKPSDAMAIISYDEKPGIQAIATPPPICRPSPACMRPSHASMNMNVTARSSLLAGIDLLTGKVHALVKDRHRSREFIEFLKLLDATYPGPHSDQVDPRQSFTRTSPKRPKLGSPINPRTALNPPSLPSTGSWLNLVEGFFSKLARSRPPPHPRRVQTGTPRIGSWLPWDYFNQEPRRVTPKPQLGQGGLI